MNSFYGNNGGFSLKDLSAVQSITVINGMLIVAKRDGTFNTIQLIDNTLAQENQAADAKTVGDEISSLKTDLSEFIKFAQQTLTITLPTT